MKLYVILACSGMSYPNCFNDLKWYMDNFRIEYEIIVVDNCLDCTYEKKNENYIVIGSDDKFHEFSCWNTGMQYIHNNLPIDSQSHFCCVTSAFMNEPNTVQKITSEDLEKFLYSDSDILGHIDSFENPHNLFGFILNYWIRTNFVVFKHNVILNWAFKLPHIENCYEKYMNGEKFYCDVLERNITQWLNMKQNVTHYKKRFFCVLYEKILNVLILNDDLKVTTF